MTALSEPMFLCHRIITLMEIYNIGNRPQLLPLRLLLSSPCSITVLKSWHIRIFQFVNPVRFSAGPLNHPEINLMSPDSGQTHFHLNLTEKYSES